MKMVNLSIRIPKATHCHLARIANHISEETGEPVNISHVIRIACMAYLKRQEPLPIRDALHEEPERPQS